MNRSDYVSAVSTLRVSANEYYSGGEPALTDYEFDALLEKVLMVERFHPEWSDGNPLTIVGNCQGVAGDVKHNTPMLSLKKVFSEKQLDSFTCGLSRKLGAASPKLVVEPKIDGLAASIHYAGGRAVSMATRGDGKFGKDITSSIKQISNIPRSANQFTGEVRGEIVFTHGQFLRASAMRDKPYSNARNGVAGAIVGNAYRAEASFYAYDFPTSEHSCHTDAMEYLEGLGFQTALSLCRLIDAYDIEGIENAAADLPVDIDGAVVKIDDYAQRDTLGSDSNCPRWAIAYKFSPTTSQSHLSSVEWNVGRTGTVTPTGVVSPVKIGRVTVSRATLHNHDFILKNDIRVGDRVTLALAGNVIPSIKSSIKEFRDGRESIVVAPSTCPNCSAKLDTSGQRLLCLNKCSTHELIAYAVGRNVLNIKGLGPVKVKELVSSGKVKSIADIFTLTSDDVGSHVVVEIERARASATVGQFLTSLGLSSAGSVICHRLAKHFKSMGSVMSASVDELAELRGISLTRAQLVRRELDANKEVIERLMVLGVTK